MYLCSIALAVIIVYVVEIKSSYSLAVNNVSSVTTLSAPNRLVITSIVFTNSQIMPEWVNRIIGRDSVFYGVNDTYSKTAKPIFPEEWKQAHNAITNLLVLPDEAYKPTCSIELMGFTKIDKFSFPFSANSRGQIPIVGYATLQSQSPQSSQIPLDIACYFRGLYENWRKENPSHQIYWSTIFYCPILQQALCDKLEAHSTNTEDNSIRFQVNLKVNNSLTWSDSFTGRIFSHHRSISQPNKIYNSKNNSQSVGEIGICVAIPYTTTDVNKYEANGVLIQEWIKYYSKLGFRTAIYDRDGANYKFIQALGDLADDPKVLYFNNTILPKLNPNAKSFKYDNNELYGEIKSGKTEAVHTYRWEWQGTDKVLTLSQCRFELKAVYGIVNTIVADFDEFLYCSKSPPIIHNQRDAIQQTLWSYKMNGVEQITFMQRVVHNTTTSTRNCIVDQVKNKGSIFRCFAPFRFIASGHSIKSAFTGHHCPLTGYHQSCPTNVPRSYDCPCASKIVLTGCEFIHFSTSTAHFASRNPIFRYKGADIDLLSVEKNEIYRTLYDDNSSSPYWH